MLYLFYAASHMNSGIIRVAAFAVLTILFAGCAGRQLPEYEPPLKRSQFMKIRTTAYTETESDHIRYQNNSAAGTTLQNGRVRSAAADWARWPVGTRFLILSTGQEYEVDDYGWAISGRNTIDLYCPGRSEMNAWGVRRVTIQILEWGSIKRSCALLGPRRNYAHVRRMLDEIRRFE
jgi:3D (Asp-Asp-Asp) domain-containing protein